MEQCFRTKICFEDTSYAAKILIEMSEKPVDFLVNPMVENPSEMVTNPLVEKSEKPVDTIVNSMVEIPSDMVTNPFVEKSEKTVDSLVKPMVEIPSELITNPLVEVPSSERQKRRSKYKFPCKYCGKIFDFIGHMQIHEKISIFQFLFVVYFLFFFLWQIYKSSK